MTRPLTVEAIEALWDELAREPHIRVIVSRNVGPEQIIKAPHYYDRKLCRTVETYLIGSAAWRKLQAECPPLPLHVSWLAHKVEFSPPEWRP